MQHNMATIPNISGTGGESRGLQKVNQSQKIKTWFQQLLSSILSPLPPYNQTKL